MHTTTTPTHSVDTLVPLPLIADPANYVACIWDLTDHPGKRAHWLNVFRTHWPTLVEEAIAEAKGTPGEATIRARTDAASRDFVSYLDAVTAQPDRFGKLDILQICYARERALQAAGMPEPYRLAKEREEKLALAALPSVLRELDAMDETSRDVALIEGIFAGNIFDLGAADTQKLFQGKTVDFRETRKKLTPRPWLVDGLDAWLHRLRTGPRHRCALLFVDNAGPDVVLGMLPFARDLLRRGTDVILTANSHPALNDVTIGELKELVATVTKLDAPLRDALAADRLELVASGNGAPLIDLSRVTPELAGAVRRRGVDLLVLEGMGRAIETNYDTRFICDTIKIAMVKDQGVAEAFKGKIYDLIMRFEPAPARK